MLLAAHSDQSLPFWVNWERELGEAFLEGDRVKIVQHVLKAARCVSFEESGYKLLTRWYHTPAFLHKMFPDCSDRCCWRCGEKEGCLLHLFSSCFRIKPFWDQVKLYLPQFTDRPIPDKPEFFLLHHIFFLACSYKKSILPHLLNTALSCVAKCGLAV